MNVDKFNEILSKYEFHKINTEQLFAVLTFDLAIQGIKIEKYSNRAMINTNSKIEAFRILAYPYTNTAYLIYTT